MKRGGVPGTTHSRHKRCPGTVSEGAEGAASGYFKMGWDKTGAKEQKTRGRPWGGTGQRSGGCVRRRRLDEAERVENVCRMIGNRA